MRGAPTTQRRRRGLRVVMESVTILKPWCESTISTMVMAPIKKNTISLTSAEVSLSCVAAMSAGACHNCFWPFILNSCFQLQHADFLETLHFLENFWKAWKENNEGLNNGLEGFTPRLKITQSATAISSATPLLLKARNSSNTMPIYPAVNTATIARFWNSPHDMLNSMIGHGRIIWASLGDILRRHPKTYTGPLQSTYLILCNPRMVDNGSSA